MKRKIKILHIVKWFYAGGAERLVSSLLEHTDHEKFDHVVLSLSDQGERLSDIEHKLHIPYTSINIERGKYNIKNWLKIFFFVLRTRPDIIKTWLPPANIAGAIIGLLINKPVIWGLHDSQPHRPHDRLHVRISKFLVTKIVCCSPAVKEVCIRLGYNPKLLNVILNGTDTDKFKFSLKGRELVRNELGISKSSKLIGMAAEYAGIKRHDNFLDAAKIFLGSHPDTHFILCGKNITNENIILKTHIQRLGIADNIHLLGIRDDMENIYSALDISTLNSTSESFGLSITESMSCERMCVATNVGILPELLKDVGEIIPVSDDSTVLSEAWGQCFSLNKKEQEESLKRGRERIIDHYSITETARNYERLFSEVS